MTDAEIIKALECHNICRISKCEECPFFPTNECSAELSGYALDLINRLKTKNNQLDETIQQLAEDINRQKAENEKLTEDYNNLIYEKDLLFDEAEAQIKAKNAEIKEWKRVVETWLMVHEKDKAKIERLRGWENLLKAEKHSLIKAEAIKELLDKIEKQAIPNEDDVYWVELDDIYNLVKEMVGDTE